MTRRMRVLTASGLVIVTIMAIVVVARADNSPIEPSSRVTNEAAVAPTSMKPTVISTTVPTPPDAVVGDALAYIDAFQLVRSGTPQLLMSKVVTPTELNTMGFGTFAYESGCSIPLEVVIFAGDFDLHSVSGTETEAGRGHPVRFLAFIYDTRVTEVIQMIGDPSGMAVQQALGDPQLPRNPDPVTTSFDVPITCDSAVQVLDGASEEEVTVYETQQAETNPVPMVPDRPATGTPTAVP